MDPLTAIGLVSNILQFLSFGHELLSSAKDVFNSPQGVTKEVQQLKILIQDVQERSKTVGTALNGDTEAASSIKEIASECESVADQLMKQLDSFQVKRTGLARKLEAIRVTGRFLWGKNEVYEMKARLFELEHRLDKWLENRIEKQQASILLTTVQDLSEKMDRLNAQSPKSELEILRSNLNNGIRILREQAKSHEKLMKDERKLIREDLEELKKEVMKSHVNALNATIVELNTFVTEFRNVDGQRRVIQSLLFPSIKRRHSDIEAAHKETLEWIFDKSCSNLLEWLEKGSGVYWVNGLAGSGKSTLMKFVSGHSKTSAALGIWAGRRPFVTASHFFWNAGEELQRSQRGLFQSLLFHILRSTPRLVKALKIDHATHEAWDIDELKKIFVRLADERSLDTKFCFFVDGLDEYDGDEEDIIQVVKYFASSPHIKVCVSSRPWPAFASEWQASLSTFKVEEFTRQDMEKYTHDKLVQNQRFADLASQESWYYKLVQEISERASGVWLWVHLVIRDLLRDIRDNESYEQLVVRLHSYPRELEQFFENIMKRIDKIHKAESAQIFLLTTTAVRPLSILSLDALHTYDDAAYALNMSIDAIKEEKLSSDYKTWQPRLQNRCRDLVKITVNPMEKPVFRYQIDFLHRTVRDFLHDKHQEELQKQAPDRFDPAVFLSMLMLVLIKKLDMVQFREELDTIIGLVDELLHYSWQIEQYSQSNYRATHQYDLIDEMNRTISHYALGEQAHWSNARDTPAEDNEEPWFEGGQCGLLALTIQAHLRLYVSEKLAHDSSLMKKAGRPLLDYALRPKRVTPIILPYNVHYDISLIDLELVKTLLENGAEPNRKIRIYQNRSPWLLFLLSCRKNWDEWSRPTKECVFSVIQLLLRYGADPTISIPPVFKTPEPNAEIQRTGGSGTSSIPNLCYCPRPL